MAISSSLQSYVFSDLSDRFCTIVTSLFLVLAAMLCFLMKHTDFFGSRITCWAPATFEDQMIKYANQYCYQSNKYFLPIDYSVPKNVSEREVPQMRSDHFVELKLQVHALQFYFLWLLWSTLSSKCGTDLTSILKVSSRVDEISEPAARQSQITLLAQFVNQSISKCGLLLSVLYLIVKFIFILNILLQIHSVNRFLKVENYLWRYEMVDRMNSGAEWMTVPAFPRTIFCDFNVRLLGNIQRYRVQCNLDISYFLINVYIIIWHWMAFVAIISIFSFIYRIIITITTFLPPCRNFWIRKLLLHVGQTLETVAPYQVTRFGSQLKPDGLMILHFIASHTNQLLASELTTEMFNLQNRNSGYMAINPTAPQHSVPPAYPDVKPK